MRGRTSHGEIAKVLPPGQYPIKDLTPEHPIYRALFQVASIPQVPAWQFWSGSGGDTSEMGALSAPGAHGGDQ